MFVLISQPYFVRNKSIIAILNSTFGLILLCETVIALFIAIRLHREYNISVTVLCMTDFILERKFKKTQHWHRVVRFRVICFCNNLLGISIRIT